MNKEKLPFAIYIVKSDLRKNWLADRVARVRDDIRQFEQLALKAGLPKLFGENGFPEAERFSSLPLVDNQINFAYFINICNRCFVESIERTGRGLGKSKYFWNDIKKSYSELWPALHRIKLYRNDEFHLNLTPSVNAALQEQIKSDFLGASLKSIPEPYFVIQQVILDGLFSAVQLELEKLS